MERPDPWEYIIAKESQLRYLCRAGCRGRLYLIDDLWTDVILDKVPRCIEMWDCERPLWTYVSSNIRAYIWKYMNKALRTAAVEVLNERHTSVEYDTRLRVIEIMESLSDKAREILYLKHIQGFTTEELSVYFDVSMGTAHKMYHEALNEAKDVCGDSE